MVCKKDGGKISEGALSKGIQSSDRIESAIAGRASYHDSDGPMKVDETLCFLACSHTSK